MPKRNPTKEFYDKNAAHWAERKGNSFYHEKEFRAFVKYFRKGARILDIGCAHGIHVPLFLGVGHNLRYEGMDISKSFLKMAHSRYPQLTFTQGDVLDAKSFPKKKFDGFWAAAVLMHLPIAKWPRMMQNIERSMKKGAVGYITVPKERFTDPATDPRHFEIFTPATFKEILATRGWKILKKGEKSATATTDWLWFVVQLP